MRVIARLDIKNEYVIKGIHLEGLRKVGEPHERAVHYYKQGVDEIIFMDAVASLYGRNNLFHIIKRVTNDIFVPITLGGGLRNLKDIQQALYSGADKVSINTEAIKRPEFISEASGRFGSQCIVGSIEAKKNDNNWEAYVDNGRERTGVDVLMWARKLQELGAGEILLTSIDCEGTQKGFDIDLIKQVSDVVSIPVIACGGMGDIKHITSLVNQVKPSAIAVASAIHYEKISINTIKKK